VCEVKRIVSKFGGSSMADDVAMLRSARVALENDACLVIVSATYGTTDKLILLSNHACSGDWSECEKIIFSLRENHFNICQRLSQNLAIKEQLTLLLDELETLARGVFLLKECSPKAYDQILSFGERMSSLLFSEAMRSVITSKEIVNFDVRDVLKTDSCYKKAIPDIGLIYRMCNESFDFSNTIFITQGFIGIDKKGNTTTLGRGGSDYSASLLAEAIDADLLQIWTDVAGIASTDPRICQNAVSIKEISYNEASEMAQYGAKVLHPTTLVPSMRKNIPVFVGSSLDSSQPGTYIRKSVDQRPLIRAITKRQNQSLLEIRTPKMLNAIGFLGNIFNVFTKHKISADCVTTSEISVAVTVEESTLKNEEFIEDLKKFGEVNIEQGYSLVSLIGNSMLETRGVTREIFNTIGDLNIRMMCLGASEYNFNLLISEEDADDAIRNLHQRFIEEKNEDCATW
jgi:aspartate kinase